MDILEFIKDLDDKELEEVVNLRIKYLEEDEYAFLPDTIGYKLDYNPSSFIMPNTNPKDITQVELGDYYNGYIPYGTRIVYGMICDNDGIVKSNGGRYYYIDDDSYILDFCKYIREKDIDSTYVLFDYVYDFIQDYFGRVQLIDRETMMNYVLREGCYFYDPTKENTFSMFKSKGNAMCSEIGLMAQNILSFLGFDVSYVMGTIKRILAPSTENTNFEEDEEIIVKNFYRIEDEEKELEEEKTRKENWEKIKAQFPVEGHAYNMITFEENGEILSILIDFSSVANVFNIKHNKIGEAPYIVYLDKEKTDKYKELKQKNKSILADNYVYLVQSPLALAINEVYKREYRTATNLKNAEKVIKLNKK